MNFVTGPIPYGIIKKTPKTKYFWRGRLDWDDRNEAGQYVKRQCRPLKVRIDWDDGNKAGQYVKRQC